MAYWLWQQQGMPVESPDADWFLAEKLLKRKYKRFELFICEMALFAVSFEKRTRCRVRTSKANRKTARPDTGRSRA